MSLYTELRTKVIGAPLDPLSEETRHNIALVAFFAWVGLGADGISSSCYGPEESFRALGEHTGLGLYLSKRLVSLVGGDIRAESEFGRGSEFQLILPVEMPREAA